MTEPDDLVGEIIAQVAREHGVALSRDDPILATVLLGVGVTTGLGPVRSTVNDWPVLVVTLPACQPPAFRILPSSYMMLVPCLWYQASCRMPVSS